MPEADINRFHPGEQAVQARLGVAEKMAKIGRRVIRDFMPDQHREFFENQTLMYVSTIDSDGRPRAGLLSGPAGFVQSPDPQTLTLAGPALRHHPPSETLQQGAKIGLLGLEYHSRRRNRVNGTITHRDNDGRLHFHVDQSFGNCPKYIQTRLWEAIPNPPAPHAEPPQNSLSEAMQTMLHQADTFFIATAFHGEDGAFSAAGSADPAARSADPAARGADPAARGADISHRGGPPGFVQVLDASRFVFPDYSGNFFFNTLGNLQRDARCSILFIDFEQGHTLELIGRGRILWDQSEVPFSAGAERMLMFELDEARLLRHALPFRFTFTGYSPHLP